MIDLEKRKKNSTLNPLAVFDRRFFVLVYFREK